MKLPWAFLGGIPAARPASMAADQLVVQAQAAFVDEDFDTALDLYKQVLACKLPTCTSLSDYSSTTVPAQWKAAALYRGNMRGCFVKPPYQQQTLWTAVQLVWFICMLGHALPRIRP